MSCAFCDGEIATSRIIYKDNLVQVFPTNIPIVTGHVLVCPVRHVQTIDALRDDELHALMSVVVNMKLALREAFSAQGFNVAWNEGALAGQSVPHLHVHVLPRLEGDGGVYGYEPRQFLYRPGSRQVSPDAELADVATMIKQFLK